jgi:uncharacterized protein (TIGR00369 family)
VTTSTMLAQAARESAGLDFLRRIAAGALPLPPISQTLGFHLVEVEEGRTVFAAVPGERHYNPIGVVHAGLAATLLDSAMGGAIQSTLAAGTGYTTLETKVNLVRPITEATGEILAEGTLIHAGSRVATADGRVTRASDGKLLAHGTSTCLILAEPPLSRPLTSA